MDSHSSKNFFNFCWCRAKSWTKIIHPYSQWNKDSRFL